MQLSSNYKGAILHNCEYSLQMNPNQMNRDGSISQFIDSWINFLTVDVDQNIN